LLNSRSHIRLLFDFCILFVFVGDIKAEATHPS